MYKKFLSVTFMLCGALFGYGQEEDRIDTDRPDQTESVKTVPKNYFQWEAGFIRERTSPSEKLLSIPTSLFKYGIGKKLELRLQTDFNSYIIETFPDVKNQVTGFQPVEVGFKAGLWEQKKWIPQTSVILHVGIPHLSSKNFSIDHLAPRVTVTMQHELTESLALGYNLGAEWDGIENNPTWFYTFAPGLDIGKRWYAYIEVFGFIGTSRQPEHNIDGGFAYYVTKDFKVDISAGFGLSEEAPDHYFAIGAAVRFK